MESGSMLLDRPAFHPADVGNRVAHPATSAATGKRTSNGSSTKPSAPRQKRRKYTPAACIDCKKRKVKCSGEAVCWRCERAGIPCEYVFPTIGTQGQPVGYNFAETEARVTSLQNQVDGLSSAVKHIQTQSSSPNKARDDDACLSCRETPTSALHHRVDHLSSKTRSPQFPGPTSSAFGFRVAHSTLHSMGLEADSTPPSRDITPDPVEFHRIEACSLESLPLADIKRLLHVYEEEVGVVYPFIDVEHYLEHSQSMYDSMHGISNCDPLNSGEGSPRNGTAKSKEIRILKIMVATGLVLEGLGQSALAQKLVNAVALPFGSAGAHIDIDFAELQIMTILSIFYFHSDEEVLAWRTVGFAARMALEMGLHRSESVLESFPDPKNQKWPSRLFWCIYVLDRRWSFGTGMPFALQDSDIDPELPTPNTSAPYLDCLIGYGKLSSKVWQAIAGFNNSERGLNKEHIGYLDFLIQQWVQSIPPDLQLFSASHQRVSETASPALQRLRVLLHVRGNQMRILIYRQNLLTTKNIMDNLDAARLVTKIAKDTISVLFDLNTTSEIYRTQQNVFNYFLVSALAVIFLAVCHSPAEFSITCRNEFYKALNLVKGLSVRSYVSRRLWKSVRRLKLIAPRLGLVASEECKQTNMQDANATQRSFVACNQSEPQSVTHAESPRSAVDFAGADYSMGKWHVGAADETSLAMFSSVSEMSQMSSDLTSLFEAFGSSTSTSDWELGNKAVRTEYDQAMGFSMPANASEVSKLFEGFI